MNIMLRPICWKKGHKWSDWRDVGIPLAYFVSTCYRCGKTKAKGDTKGGSK